MTTTGTNNVATAAVAGTPMPAKVIQAEPQKIIKQVRFSKSKTGGKFQTKTTGADTSKATTANVVIPKCTINEIETITEQLAVLGKLDESLGESDLEEVENPSEEESDVPSEMEEN